MNRLLEPWRTRLLWLSLALNLFAAALIAAPHLTPLHEPGPPSFDRLVERMARDLPAPDAATFRDAMARERPWYELGRQQMTGARNELAQSVGHEPFDPATARTALQAMQEKMRESAARFDESLVTAFAQLSPEGRTQLSRGMRRGPR